MRRAVARLTGLKLLGAMLGLAFSISQARIFGASGQMDAYFVAMAGVYMITSLVQGGQIAEVFVPEYLKAKHSRSQRDASALFSAVVTRMLAAVGGLSAASIILSPVLVGVLGPGLAEPDAAMATDMFRWASLMVALTLFSSFVNVTLNAEGVFGRAELTGLASQTIALAMLWSLHGKIGIWVLIYSQAMGKVIELASGAWFLRRKGIEFKLSWHADGHELGKFFRVLWATSGYVAATQVLASTITACATLLPAGSLSLLSYVRLYCTKLSALLLGPLSTVLFSKIANLAAKGSDGIARSLSIPLRATILVMASVAACSWLGGEYLLGLLLGDGLSSPASLGLAHQILNWGLLGALASGVGGLFRKTAVSLGKGRRLYVQWTAAQLASAAASYACISTFGEAGLACIMPINMSLLAWVSIKVAEEAGVSLKGAMVAASWNRPWVLFAVGVLGLPWAIGRLPLETGLGELAGPARLCLYVVSIAPMGAIALRSRRPR